MSQISRDDLVVKVHNKTGMSRKDVNTVLTGLIEAITETVAAGDGISLVGLASFNVVDRAERQGHNPKTGEALTIPAQKALTIKPSSKLKQAVKGAK